MNSLFQRSKNIRVFVCFTTFILFNTFSGTIHAQCLLQPGSIADDQSSGSNCIFQMTPGGTYADEAVAKFDNGGGGPGDDDIDLSAGFDECFNIFLGCDDAGGDGMAFVFSDAGYFQGDDGGGLGYNNHGGTNPDAIAIEFDVHQNDNSDLYPINNTGDVSWDNEIANDHVTVDCGANIDNPCPGAPIVDVGNLEDGNIHNVCIRYDHASTTLEVDLDGATIISLNIDLIAQVGTSAYWGWTASTGGVTNEMWVSYNGTTSPPAFTPDCNPSLPVQFITLQANRENNLVNVQWTTATEHNNSHFEVERSSDLVHWNNLSSIAGQGNSNTISYYSVDDTNPLHEKAYYRIKQVDFDGSGSYSKTVTVNPTTGTTVSPTPFSNELTIQHHGLQKVVIYNCTGSVVFEEIFTIQEPSLTIITPDIPEGIYLIGITSNKEVTTQKIIKQ